MFKSYKQKLLLTPEQKHLCHVYAGINRQVYNIALIQRRMAYSLCRKSVNYYQQAAELTSLKEVFPYIKLAPSQTLQQSLLDLQQAYDRFFQGLAGYPSFRKKHRNDSFRFPDPTKFNITRVTKRKGKIHLPKLGVVYFRWTRAILGNLKDATIKLEPDGWYVCISSQQELDVAPNLNPPISIDRGVTHTLATSDPVDGKYLHDLPKSIRAVEATIEHYQQKLSKKKRQSNRRSKLKHKISKLHLRLRNIRHNWLHQMSTKIAKNHGTILMERLNIVGMTASNKGTLEQPGINVACKSGLNRAILRQGWGYFQTFTSYKAIRFGSVCEFIPPAYTSQRCFKCKHAAKDSRQNEQFKCVQCGHVDHADINAAKNIKEAGLASLAHTASNSKMRTTRQRSRMLAGIPAF